MRRREAAGRASDAERFSKIPDPGRKRRMTDAHDTPTLDDVLETTEQAIPDRHEHAKAPPRPDDDALEERVEEEREAVGLEDSPPDDELPSG
jgi:hypothetical protein